MRTMIRMFFMVMCLMSINGLAFAADRCCDTTKCDLPAGCSCDNPKGQWCVTACRACCGTSHANVCPKKKSTADFDASDAVEADDKKKDEKKNKKGQEKCPAGMVREGNTCRDAMCPPGQVKDGNFCRPADWP